MKTTREMANDIVYSKWVNDSTLITRIAQALQAVMDERDMLRAALEGCLPTMVWFHEGPYGPSPEPDALTKCLEILAKVSK